METQVYRDVFQTLSATVREVWEASSFHFCFSSEPFNRQHCSSSLGLNISWKPGAELSFPKDCSPNCKTVRNPIRFFVSSSCISPPLCFSADILYFILFSLCKPAFKSLSYSLSNKVPPQTVILNSQVDINESPVTNPD